MYRIGHMIFSKWTLCVLIGMITIGCTTDINLKTDPPGLKENNQTTDTKSSHKGESMKFSKNPPESWLWSHDAQPGHINDMELPGMHLVRLSAYGSDKRRRFAGIIFLESGVESVYLEEISATEIGSKIAHIDARPVSITAGEVNGELRFTLVLHKGTGPKTNVHINLDEGELNRLANDQHRIADFTTYVENDIRKYAAIVEERPGPSLIFTHITAKELNAQFRKHNVTPIRIRGFLDGDSRYFTAVAEHLDVGDWNWYDDIDGDTVAKKLDANDAYPFDLEAYRQHSTEYGVHYTVVMYRDRDDD